MPPEGERRPVSGAVRGARGPTRDLGKSESCGILRAVQTITIRTTDDRYTLRETLRRVEAKQVLISLPWDVERGWSQPLDYEVPLRTALERGQQVAFAIADPVQRAVARKVGVPVFRSEADAQSYFGREGRFPSARSGTRPEQPKLPWWAPIPQRPKPVAQKRPPLWLLAIEGILLLAVLGVVGVAFLLSVPTATIVVTPQTLRYSRIVPVSVSSELEMVDLERGVIPSSRIGDEFEGYAEVITSGRGYDLTGRATGEVLLTNLLGQDYQVPASTVVRTSAGSYPVRYQLTQAVTVPAFGQAYASVEALVEGPRGNIDAYQINLVEGVAGFAIRVTNPAPISGAQSTTVRTVTNEDRERAWDLAAQQVMAKAYNGLQEMASLEPGRFLPRQSLIVQAAPRAAYTHLVGEQTDVLGLSLRLLVTGQAVDARDAQAVAYHQLLMQLPENYTLTDARYSIGEAAEEDVGYGQFTFYVTAEGLATAKIDAEAIKEIVAGERTEDAVTALADALPLAAPPTIEVSPAWFPYVPRFPIRTDVEVRAAGLAP